MCHHKLANSPVFPIRRDDHHVEVANLLGYDFIDDPFRSTNRQKPANQESGTGCDIAAASLRLIIFTIYAS